MCLQQIQTFSTRVNFIFLKTSMQVADTGVPMYELVQRAKVESPFPDEYQNLPSISATAWNRVGDALAANEAAVWVTREQIHTLVESAFGVSREKLQTLAEGMEETEALFPVSAKVPVPRDWWISLRFDLRNMGTHFAHLRRLGVVTETWDSTFHDLMCQAVRAVMQTWKGLWGSTHSDEGEVILAGLKKETSEHAFNGIPGKLNSLVAAEASSTLNRSIHDHAEALGVCPVTLTISEGGATSAADDDILLDGISAACIARSLLLQCKKREGALFRAGEWSASMRAAYACGLAASLGDTVTSLPFAPDADADATDTGTRAVRFVVQQPCPDDMSRSQWCRTLCASIASAFGVPANRFHIHVQPLSSVLPVLTFDCRRGLYRSERDALLLLLWRQQDCRRNGISDAVFEREKKLVGLQTHQKLQWLHDQALLPLADGMAYGSLFHRRPRESTFTNWKTGETSVRASLEIVQLKGQDVIRLLREEGDTFPWRADIDPT